MTVKTLVTLFIVTQTWSICVMTKKQQQNNSMYSTTTDILAKKKQFNSINNLFCCINTKKIKTSTKRSEFFTILSSELIGNLFFLVTFNFNWKIKQQISNKQLSNENFLINLFLYVFKKSLVEFKILLFTKRKKIFIYWKIFCKFIFKLGTKYEVGSF